MERYLIKFEKLNNVKFISHLDTMRTLYRTFNRADLPLCYTHGFNPHPNISIAAPLSLGVGSNCEYADIELNDYVNEKHIKDSLNSNVPDGLRIVLVYHVKTKQPASMALVKAAEYSITLNSKTTKENILITINKILLLKEINKMKKTKSGEKLINFRPFIKSLTLKNYSTESVTINAVLQTGSEGNMNPDIIVDLLNEHSDNLIYGFPIITREQIYTENNNQLIDLASFFLGK